MTATRIQLAASDGHRFDGWLARPAGKPKAGIVVVQEIFGVTPHIRRVAEDFAARGYLALAPAYFDRVQPGVDLPYSEIATGRDLMLQLQLPQVALDTEAAVGVLREAGKVGLVGYCWGGSVADLAACRTSVDAAVAYYGRQMVGWLTEAPRCPVQYHFGRQDSLIPMDVVEQVRAGRPGQELFIYDEAGHGFNCDERHEYHAASAQLALDRSLRFFAQHL
jgi:carboxymethylenebutenolidase